MENIHEKCACQGSFLDKFLQPAVLIVLSRGSSHGFQIITDLENSGMVTSLDPAGLYRTLKRMEETGLVSSFWDTDSSAKPKRVYSITQEGQHCLERWAVTLRDYRSSIDRLLEEIGKNSGMITDDSQSGADFEQ
ncbi:MAG: helix-turn-helix transcriptional regulator [Clostridia bacterium]|nr:helix-turn-helix transcriptional regulator [Clostridia bacterium]